MNIQDWFPLGWTGWISLQSNGLSRVFSNTTVQKQFFLILFLNFTILYWFCQILKWIRHRYTCVQFLNCFCSSFRCSAFFIVQFSHPYMTTGKTIALTRQTIVGKFNMLSSLVITFLPRSKHLLISWLQSPSAVILELKKIKSDTVSPSICHKVMGPDAMILIFWMLSFKPTFSLSSFTFIKRLFSSSSLSAIRVVSSAYLRLLIFLLAILIPACASSSPAFLMMYSAHKLNKQGDDIQPWRTPFSIWNQSVVPCPVLTVASWLAYRILKREGGCLRRPYK